MKYHTQNRGSVNSGSYVIVIIMLLPFLLLILSICSQMLAKRDSHSSGDWPVSCRYRIFV